MISFYILLLLVISVVACDNVQPEIEIACNPEEVLINEADILTWEEIYADSIISMVGKTIVIKSKLYWHTDFGSFNNTPEINPAGKIKLLFEDADQYIKNQTFHGQERGNVRLVSNQIEKYIDHTEKQEKYAFNCKELLNNDKYYLIQGSIEFIDPPGAVKLHDQTYVTQSNDVVYWSQKYKFLAEIIN